MDKGPWKVVNRGYTGEIAGVESEDFEHDVRLNLSGDFASEADRRAYCEWLAAKLNGATVQPKEIT